jgi:diguanylate cyclase (GGDEF)-like protein
LVFAAAIPLVNLLINIVGREVRHSDTLVCVNQSLKREAGTDRLTGVWNRRALDRLFRRETGEARRTGRPLSVVLLDLDHFKAVNDQWGHQAGDQALVETVRTVASVLRQGDSLVRWGGDEFLVLCPGVGNPEAAALGDKIVQAVANNPQLALWNLGISAGIAVWSGTETIESLLARADSLLYLAKREGTTRPNR